MQRLMKPSSYLNSTSLCGRECTRDISCWDEGRAKREGDERPGPTNSHFVSSNDQREGDREFTGGWEQTYQALMICGVAARACRKKKAPRQRNRLASATRPRCNACHVYDTPSLKHRIEAVFHMAPRSTHCFISGSVWLAERGKASMDATTG